MILLLLFSGTPITEVETGAGRGVEQDLNETNNSVVKRSYGKTTLLALTLTQS